MRKFLTIVVTLLMAVSIASCAGKGKSPVGKGKGKSPVVQTKG